MRVLRWLMAVVGLAALLVGWVWGSPPLTAPDEAAHYVKTIGVAYGQWTGQVRGPVDPRAEPQRRYLQDATRNFRFPARFQVHSHADCVIFRGDLPVDCPPRGPARNDPLLANSYVGAYHPFLYLPGGLLARLTSGGDGAFYAARAGGAAVALALLAAALAVAGSRVMRAGVLVAATPLVIFLSASLGTSGIEASAALCFLTAGLRLARVPAGDGGPFAVWAVWGLAGGVLALARGLGPVFLVCLALLPLLLRGWRSTGRLCLDAGTRAAVPLGVLPVALADSLYWDIAVQPSPPLDLVAAAGQVGRAVADLPTTALGWVGVFGYQDTRLPAAAYAVGLTLLLLPPVVALLLASWRERMVLLVALLGVPAASVTVAVALEYPIGFNNQARFVLALAVAVPLVSAYIFDRRGMPAVLPALVVVVAAGLQATAWWWNARRYAVGDRGPLDFLADAVYRPPGGWTPWIVSALTGAALVGLSQLLPEWRRVQPAGPDQRVSAPVSAALPEPARAHREDEAVPVQVPGAVEGEAAEPSAAAPPEPVPVAVLEVAVDAARDAAVHEDFDSGPDAGSDSAPGAAPDPTADAAPDPTADAGVALAVDSGPVTTVAPAETSGDSPEDPPAADLDAAAAVEPEQPASPPGRDFDDADRDSLVGSSRDS